MNNSYLYTAIEGLAVVAVLMAVILMGIMIYKEIRGKW